MTPFIKCPGCGTLRNYPIAQCACGYCFVDPLRVEPDGWTRCTGCGRAVPCRHCPEGTPSR